MRGMIAAALAACAVLCGCGAGSATGPAQSRSAAAAASPGRIPAGACEGMSQVRCRAAYVLAGLNWRKCNAATGDGCIDGPDTPSAAPSPVSTAAALTGNCVMGGSTWIVHPIPPAGSINAPVSGYGPFEAGTPRTSNGVAPVLGYQLTLTNNSGATADVGGFAVVFDDAAGAEAGSDQETASGGTFIAAGQSLTWTELASAATDGSSGAGSDQNIPGNAATCSLVQWSQP